MKTKILVVDDDISIRTLLDGFLTRRNYEVCLTADGIGMSQAIKRFKPDLIILDLGLPGEDGLELTRKLRSSSNIPIIMLTARSEEVDRIIGLEMGADDYLPKPFSTHELEARIKSILRRTKNTFTDAIDDKKNKSTKKYVFEDWTLDLNLRKLFNPDSKEINLTAGELNLLISFIEHRNRVLSREQLLEYSHLEDEEALLRSIDVQVMRLRGKIEVNPKSPLHIKTVRSAGYIFESKVFLQ